ncbi:alkyl hydroperoxide reductase subunit F [Marinomonas sp. 15G1-11]|uniref:Alkyl hydroperoxide reductase subunit F n=1 Tax=Marinomonas phaeophyticola TaxID=3004091 RepID=A0ABT4JXP8_9GAMM|nr:alkyl hydroperoxide reductase subunit F [Marinomonas sp. 15G1-11]MCZ2723157.1 alkyl hydroperoxide reductase subunit F [Marinomonas sp. 15G1-11]
MLDATIKTQLNAYLEKLVNPIDVKVNVDEKAKSQELLSLAEDIASLSEKINLTKTNDRAKKIPSMSVGATGSEPRVTFAGIPMGHEFTSLILALLQSGGHPAKEAQAILDQVKALDRECTFETYISLSCQNCPEVVQALNLMSILNPKIKHTMIDGALFQKEVEERNILAVPAVYLNGELLGQGRMSLEDIVNKVDDEASEKQAASLSEKDAYDVLVVGGGPAGAAAAIYAARKGIRTGVVAERFGGQVSDTMAIENFISVKATEGPKLVANLEQHVLDYDVDIVKNQRAQKVIPADQSRSGLIEIELASGARLKSRSIIIATGARWREMNVPGEQEYRGRGVAYCPHCDGPLFKGKRVSVIGGGNSGIEAAIDLAGLVEHVTVFEFTDTLRADDVLIRKANSLTNVTIIKNAMTTEVIGDGNRVTGMTYQDRLTGDNHEIELAGIFVQIGLLPNTDFLKGDIALSNRGEVEIDARGATSVDGVFAAGDATTVPYKQIIIAMGAGATASLAAFDHLIRLSDSGSSHSEEAA